MSYSQCMLYPSNAVIGIFLLAFIWRLGKFIWIAYFTSPELIDGAWYWVKYDGLWQEFKAPAMYRAETNCFYSYQFSGISRKFVIVLRPA